MARWLMVGPCNYGLKGKLKGNIDGRYGEKPTPTRL